MSPWRGTEAWGVAMRHSDAKSRHVSGALRQRALPIMDTATAVENGFPEVPLCFNDYTDISRLLLIDALRWHLRGGGALLCSGPRRHQGQRHGSSQPGASPLERRFQNYADLKGRVIPPSSLMGRPYRAGHLFLRHPGRCPGLR